MKEELLFPNREAFHAWLLEHATSSEGVWLLFGKPNGPSTINATEALEEALCFGWIDGVMERMDDTIYKKYFSQRRKISKWSEKNKQLVEVLEQQGKMMECGRMKVAEAKKNGQWSAAKPTMITEDQILVLSNILKAYEPAYTNFKAMSPSVQRTYTKAYLDAKTESGQAKRIAWMVDRLDNNLKPM